MYILPCLHDMMLYESLHVASVVYLTSPWSQFALTLTTLYGTY